MLNISQTDQQQIIDHLQTCYPEEGCGLLAGVGDQVLAVYPIENELHSPTRYRMAPAAQIEAMLAIEAQGWALLGIFHSHPHSAAYPSATDVAQNGYPDVAQLIVSLQTEPPHCALFTIKRGIIVKQRLVLV